MDFKTNYKTLIRTKDVIDKEEFEKLSDRYFLIIEKITSVLKEENLTLEESLLVLDSIIDAIGTLKYQAYDKMSDIL